MSAAAAAATLIAVYCCALLVSAASTSDRARDFDDEMSQPIQQQQRSSRTAANCCGAPPTPSTVRAVVHDAKNAREIPLNVIMELNQVKNVSELFNKFLPDTNLHEAQRLIASTGFQSRTSVNIERKATTVPKPSGCSPENRSVSLKDNDDTSLYYYPPCTRINRCGGCCAHDLLACQPTKIEMLNFEVMISQYNGAGKLEFIGRKSVSVEQHMKCKCDCIVKEKDCNAMQIYYPNECRCVCSNEDDRDKCNEEHDLKLWNPGTCTCQCRETQECTSGFTFDPNTCRCEPVRIKTKNHVYESYNRNRYTIEET